MNGVNKLGCCRPGPAGPTETLSGSTISELFEAWFGTAADGWSPSWRERSSYAGGGNGRQNSRRDEFGVLAVDALGMVWDNPAERAHRIVPVRYTRRDVQVRGSCHSGESFRQKGRPRWEPRTTRYPCGPSSGGALRTDGVRTSLQPRGRCPATGSDLRGVPSTHRGSCRKLRR